MLVYLNIKEVQILSAKGHPDFVHVKTDLPSSQRKQPGSPILVFLCDEGTGEDYVRKAFDVPAKDIRRVTA